jgi:hypothetical protein
MFEKFRFGSYRIEETDIELANSKKNNSKLSTVSVYFLDGTNSKFYLDVSNFYFFFTESLSDLLVNVLMHLYN